MAEETPDPNPVQGIQLHSQAVPLANGSQGVLLRFQLILDPEAARRFAEAMLANAQTAALNLTIAQPGSNGNAGPKLLRP